MPYYLYECPEDGLFEIFQSIKDDKLTNCPVCEEEVKKLINTEFSSNPKESYESFCEKIKEESDKYDKPKMENDADFIENIYGHAGKVPDLGIKRYDPKKHKFTKKSIKKFKKV